jgi:hypothetical protein
MLVATAALLAAGAAGTAVAQDQIVSDTQPNPNCDAGAATHDDIQDAVDAASAGDTIVVCPGTYNEAVTVDESVRIVADKPDSTATADLTVLRDVDGNGTAFDVQADDVSIEGFAITNYSDAGVAAAATASTDIAGLNVNRTAVNESGTGVSLSADSGTLSDATVDTVALSSNQEGIELATQNAGTVTGVEVSEALVNESDVGVLLDGSTGTLSDTRIERADIGSTEGNAVAGVEIAAGSASNYDNVTVTKSLVRNNGDGVLVDSAVGTDLTRSDVNVSYNLIRNNGVGVQNDNPNTVFDARLNYWGDSSGPSSATSSDLEDPVLGVAANGNGDSVSEGQSGVSNVRFAPSIGGKRSCEDGQHVDPVPDETVETDFEGETLGGPATDFVGVCVWDRSILPLRSTSASAAQSILNIPTFVDTEDGQVPINRQELNVHEKNQQVNVTYEETTGANTTRYANQDGQVLVARVTGQGLDDSASVDDLFSADFNALSGSGTFGTDSVEFVAVENVTLDSDGTLPSGVQFTPSDGGAYVAVLTANEVGEGYALENGNLTGNVHKNDITAIGFEAIAVRETASTADPGNGQLSPNDPEVYTGSSVDFDVDAGFNDGNFTHAVVLYNEDNFTDSTLVIDVNGSFDSGDLTLDNGTLKGTLTGPDWTTENVTIEVDGPLEGLLNNVTVAGGFTIIDSDAAAITSAERSETVTIDTSGFQSNGTYRYVHAANASDGRFSTSDGTIEVVCQSIPQGVDTNNNGEIDTLEILTAIDTYWRVDEPVPDTCGKTIPTLDQNGQPGILTLIDDFWRPGTEVTY